jgi:hypothetical protein
MQDGLAAFQGSVETSITQFAKCLRQMQCTSDAEARKVESRTQDT